MTEEERDPVQLVVDRIRASMLDFLDNSLYDYVEDAWQDHIDESYSEGFDAGIIYQKIVQMGIEPESAEGWAMRDKLEKEREEAEQKQTLQLPPEQNDNRLKQFLEDKTVGKNSTGDVTKQ
jgi:hypothetical protein